MTISKKQLFYGFFLIFSLPLLADSQSLKVRIVNGTSGKVGSADKLKVILLQQAMKPIREISSVSGSFSIDGLDLPEGVPVLLQASYQGATYNKMVPPVPVMRSKEQTIEVFDATDNDRSVKTRSLVQLTKYPDRLQVHKIFIIQNTKKPAMAYSPSQGLDVYVPENSEGLQGSWTQGDSKMGIPLSFQSKSNSVQSITRAVLPGNTEVQISYSIPWSKDSVEFQDKILFENSDGSFRRPVFLRPKDMVLSTDSSTPPVELQDGIPEGLSAYMVSYNKISGMVNLQLSGGIAVQPRFNQEPRQIVNGSLIPEWDTALVAVLGFLALMYSIHYGIEFFVRKKG